MAMPKLPFTVTVISALIFLVDTAHAVTLRCPAKAQVIYSGAKIAPKAFASRVIRWSKSQGYGVYAPDSAGLVFVKPPNSSSSLAAIAFAIGETGALIEVSADTYCTGSQKDLKHVWREVGAQMLRWGYRPIATHSVHRRKSGIPGQARDDGQGR